jgi:hypothetical protein
MPGMTSVLAPRSFALPGRWREGRRDSQQRPRRYAGGAGEQLPASRAPRLPSGRQATRVAGASGASAPSVLRRSDSTGTRTPCSMTRAARVRAFPAATPERFCSGDTFVPAGNSAELGARRRETLDARPKGMRGRLRWFTPSRLARELKTAKIGKGQGGSTQPIRC